MGAQPNSFSNPDKPASAGHQKIFHGASLFYISDHQLCWWSLIRQARYEIEYFPNILEL